MITLPLELAILHGVQVLSPGPLISVEVFFLFLYIVDVKWVKLIIDLEKIVHRKNNDF